MILTHIFTHLKNQQEENQLFMEKLNNSHTGQLISR